MKSDTLDSLKKLTKEEKLGLIEFLWDEVTKETIIEIPEHHKKILSERIDLMNNGKITYKSWDEIKQKYSI